jgi:hypothetical protein
MKLFESLFAKKCHATLAALAILALASSASATRIASWTFETSPPAIRSGFGEFQHPCLLARSFSCFDAFELDANVLFA